MSFRSDIEGLRGVAVLLVVLFHIKAPGFAGGFVGVDVFLVISGFLITGNTVREIERESFSFVTFYGRRVRRLIPAWFVVALTTMAASHWLLAPFEQVEIGRSAIAAAAYLSNMEYARQATDYLAGSADHDPFLHTWSLSVEEQFYLAWPLLLVLLSRARAKSGPARIWLVAALGTIATLSFMLGLAVTHLAQPWAFFSVPTRIWEFALGALVALAPTTPFDRVLAARPAQWVSPVLLVGFALAVGSEDPFPGWRALLPCLATAAVLRSGSLSPSHAVGGGSASLPCNYLVAFRTRGICGTGPSSCWAEWPSAGGNSSSTP